MITTGEKFVTSLILSVVLILNISVPVVYAIEKAAEKIEPVQYCNLFCNLSPSTVTMAKESGKVSCPHHLKEIKKKRLADFFQCKIGPVSCHDNTPIANTSSAGEPCLLSKHPINQLITAAFFDFCYSTISSQIFASSFERPPSKLYS